MKFSDLAALSTKNLTRRPGRTALTVVGVVVGTCAVIVMISLGIAMNKSNEELLQGFGDLTQISVYGGGYDSRGGQVVTLNDAALTAMQQLQNVTAVTPFYNAYTVQGTIAAQKNQRYTCDYSGAVTGVYPDALPAMGFVLSGGSWLSETQTYPNGKIPVLVCDGTAYRFADSRKNSSSRSYQRYQGQLDAAGNQVAPFFDINDTTLTLKLSNGDEDNPKTKTYDLVIVGCITTDAAKGWWTQDGIVMRISDMRALDHDYKLLTGDRNKTETTYDSVTVKVDDVAHVDAVDDTLQKLGYSTYSMSQIRKEMQSSVAKSQLILGGLAAVSLLVAALNIANTMTMAIYERTREIGVMKVLGCELGSIRTMFLIESGCIGFVGGVAGAAVSLLLSFVMNHISMIAALFGQSVDLSGMMDGMGGWGGSGQISIIPPWLVLAALAFATVIGLLSGLAPANRAVKISALEAIRHE